jgi:hypothetical protein
MLSSRFVPRPYNEEKLGLRGRLQTAVRRVGGWCEMAAGLEVSHLEQWVTCRTVAAGRKVSTQAEDIVGICYEPTTGEDTADWECLLTTCRSKLLRVWISDSATVTCRYDLQVFNKSSYEPKPHTMTWQYCGKTSELGVSTQNSAATRPSNQWRVTVQKLLSGLISEWKLVHLGDDEGQ